MSRPNRDSSGAVITSSWAALARFLAPRLRALHQQALHLSRQRACVDEQAALPLPRLIITVLAVSDDRLTFQPPSAVWDPNTSWDSMPEFTAHITGLLWSLPETFRGLVRVSVSVHGAPRRTVAHTLRVLVGDPEQAERDAYPRKTQRAHQRARRRRAELQVDRALASQRQMFQGSARVIYAAADAVAAARPNGDRASSSRPPTGSPLGRTLAVAAGSAVGSWLHQRSRGEAEGDETSQGSSSGYQAWSRRVPGNGPPRGDQPGPPPRTVARNATTLPEDDCTLAVLRRPWVPVVIQRGHLTVDEPARAGLDLTLLWAPDALYVLADDPGGFATLGACQREPGSARRLTKDLVRWLRTLLDSKGHVPASTGSEDTDELGLPLRLGRPSYTWRRRMSTVPSGAPVEVWLTWTPRSYTLTVHRGAGRPTTQESCTGPRTPQGRLSLRVLRWAEEALSCSGLVDPPAGATAAGGPTRPRR